MTSRRGTALALTLVGAALATGMAREARAYTCIASNCAGYCKSPAPFKLGKPSDDLGPDVSESEVKRSMEAWTKPTCTKLQVQYGGRTEEAPANGNAVIAWVESGWTSGSGVIGVTTGRLGGGCLTSHMNLNGVNFKWVVGTPARGEVNAFSIIAHESGHFLGLGHSTAANAIMKASYSGGVLSLTDDDTMGICKIYPGAGGAVVPTTDCQQQGCATGFTCVEGACKRATESDGGAPAPTADAAAPARRDGGGSGTTGPARDGGAAPSTPPAHADAAAMPTPPPAGGGSAKDGDDCDTNDDCRSTLCLELGGRPICSRLCQDNGDCARGFACKKVGAEAICAPVVATGNAADGGAAPGVKSANLVGGCTIAPTGGSSRGSSGGLMALGLGLLALVTTFRRRSNAKGSGSGRL